MDLILLNYSSKFFKNYKNMTRYMNTKKKEMFFKI